VSPISQDSAPTLRALASANPGASACQPPITEAEPPSFLNTALKQIVNDGFYFRLTSNVLGAAGRHAACRSFRQGSRSRWHEIKQEDFDAVIFGVKVQRAPIEQHRIASDARARHLRKRAFFVLSPTIVLNNKGMEEVAPISSGLAVEQST